MSGRQHKTGNSNTSGPDTLWASAALLAATIALGTTSSIYAASSDDFAFGLVQIAVVLLAGCAVLAGLVVTPGLLMPRTARAAWSGLVFGAATYIWFYSTFVVYDFGLLDGELLAIEEEARWIWPELVLMLGWLVAAVLAHRRYASKCRALVRLLVMVTVVTTVIALVRDLPKWNSIQPESSRELFSFHPQENVLIVLLDTFQADLFQQTLEEQPELSAAFDGFIFFPDTVGRAPTTAMTMPGIHTGLEYENGWSVREYFRLAKREEGFLEAVAQAGHEVTLINAFGFCPKSGALCREPELVMEAPLRKLGVEALQLLDLAVFRAVPLALKQKVYAHGQWFLIRHLGFDRDGGRIGMSVDLLDRLAREAEVSAARPTTKFVHLPTPHPPLITRQDCSFAEKQLEHSRRALLDQGRCALAAFVRILDSLEQLDIYDETTVVLMSDHGARMASRWAGRAQDDRRWPAMVGGANPLLAIKPAHRRGPIEASTLQARISDVGATVCGVVAGCSYDRGVSLLDGTAELDRRRRYLYYRRWRTEFWRSEKAFPATLYEISGPMKERTSWRVIDQVQGDS